MRGAGPPASAEGKPRGQGPVFLIWGVRVTQTSVQRNCADLCASDPRRRATSEMAQILCGSSILAELVAAALQFVQLGFQPVGKGCAVRIAHLGEVAGQHHMPALAAVFGTPGLRL